MRTHSLTHTQEYNQQATYVELVAKSSCHFALRVAAIFGMRNEVPKSLDGWCMNFRDSLSEEALCATSKRSVPVQFARSVSSNTRDSEIERRIGGAVRSLPAAASVSSLRSMHPIRISVEPNRKNTNRWRSGTAIRMRRKRLATCPMAVARLVGERSDLASTTEMHLLQLLEKPMKPPGF